MDGAADGPAEMLPEAMEDESVEVVAMFAEPRDEAAVVSEAGVYRAKGVRRAAEVAEERRGGIVEGQDFSLAADSRICGDDAANAVRRATRAGVQGPNDVKYAQLVSCPREHRWEKKNSRGLKKNRGASESL
jgi:hypothetical protein